MESRFFSLIRYTDDHTTKAITTPSSRLRLEVIAIAAFLPYPKLSEMVADQWRKIGIQADVREMERGLGFAKQTNNEHQLFVWNNGGTELLYLSPPGPCRSFLAPRSDLNMPRGTRPAASKAPSRMIRTS